MSKKDAKLNNKFDFHSLGGYFVIITAVSTLLIFSTINTAAFVVPKSFLLRLLTFSIAVYHAAAGGFKIKNHPVNFALFCYFLSVFFSMFASVNVLASLLRLSEYLSYFLIFLFTYNYFERANVNKLINALLYSAVPIVFYGILQYMQIDFSFWQKPEGRMDLFSTLGNVNWYALYLSAMIPLIAYGAFREGASKLHRLIFNTLLFFAIASLIISYSRTAVIAFVISVFMGAMLYFGLYKLRISRLFIIRAAVLVIIFSAVAGVFSFYNPVSKTRFAEGGFLSRMKAGFSLAEHNVAQRLFIWRITLEMYALKPVLGLGPGAFKIKYLQYQKDFLKRADSGEAFDDIAGNAKEAHNDYIQTLAECGSAGFAAMAYFFFIIYKTGFSFLASARGEFDDHKFLALAAMTGLAAYLTGALADFPMHVPPNAMMIFILSAIIIIAADKNRSARPGESVARQSDFKGEAGGLADDIEITDKLAHLYSLKVAFTVLMLIMIVFLVIMPFAADCLAVIGQNHLKDHNFEAAIPYLTRSVALNPAQGDALYLLGTAYIGLAAPANKKNDKELLERGRDFLIKSINYTTDKGIYNNLGFIAIRNQNYDEAVGHFENALGCDPKSADSLNNLGIVYYHKKIYDKAEYYYKKALKMNPYFLTAANNLGDLYSKNNDFEKAAEYYSITVESSVETVISENQRRNIFNFTPASCLSEKARAYYQIAEIHNGRGALEKALGFYIRSYENITTLPQIPLKIALINFKLGRKEEGAKYANRVLEGAQPGSDYHRQALDILSKYNK
jgi:tetratricopeptide (TPR) repeat protein